MNRTIRIIVADDQELVRSGLRELLACESDLEVVGEASDGSQSIVQCLVHNPDILLLDLQMPVTSGLEVMTEIAQVRPHIRIIVLTGSVEDETILQCLQRGAVGFLPKTVAPAELVHAIRAAMGEGASLHPRVTGAILRRLSQPQPPTASQSPLTAREREILYLVARGCSNEEIAHSLLISPYTVRTHIYHVLKKLHLNNRTQVALYVLKKGLAQLSDIW